MDHPLMITWMQHAHAIANPHERPRALVVRCVVSACPEPSVLALLRPVPAVVRVSPRDGVHAIATCAVSDAGRVSERHAA